MVFEAESIWNGAVWTVLGNLKDFLGLRLDEVDQTFTTVFIAIRSARMRGQLVPVADRHGTVSVSTLLSDPSAWLPTGLAVVTIITILAVHLGFAVARAEGCPDSRKYPTAISIAVFVVLGGNWDASTRLFTFFSSYLLVCRMQDLL